MFNKKKNTERARRTWIWLIHPKMYSTLHNRKSVHLIQYCFRFSSRFIGSYKNDLFERRKKSIGHRCRYV